MCDRIKAATDARSDAQFVVMARTDARAGEGPQAAVDRAVAYVEAGADMIFAEALPSLDEYRQFTQAVPVPVLANITEFGKTPLFTVQELDRGRRTAGPLSVVGIPRHERGGSKRLRDAAREGTQSAALDRMQTREELYEVLEYYAYERKLDELFERRRNRGD